MLLEFGSARTSTANSEDALANVSFLTERVGWGRDSRTFQNVLEHRVKPVGMKGLPVALSEQKVFFMYGYYYFIAADI